MNEHDAELLSAPHLLEELPLKGAVVTGDALYCQRALCQQIVAAAVRYNASRPGPALQLLGLTPI